MLCVSYTSNVYVKTYLTTLTNVVNTWISWFPCILFNLTSLVTKQILRGELSYSRMLWEPFISQFIYFCNFFYKANVLLWQKKISVTHTQIM